MTGFDLSPLFRTAIGFDQLARLVNSASGSANAQSYPPYNIEKTGEETYRLTMAVAGFRPEDLELTVQDNTLLVTGRVNALTAQGQGQGQGQGQMLYRGIAGRSFERRFVLAEHIVVEGADLQNGLLHVSLKRVIPETLKPRRITIGAPAAVANDAAGHVQAA